MVATVVPLLQCKVVGKRTKRTERTKRKTDLKVLKVHDRPHLTAKKELATNGTNTGSVHEITARISTLAKVVGSDPLHRAEVKTRKREKERARHQEAEGQKAEEAAEKENPAAQVLDEKPWYKPKARHVASSSKVVAKTVTSANTGTYRCALSIRRGVASM